MGDGAEDAYDKALDEYIDFTINYLSLSDEELFDGTSRARKPMIVGIRNYYKANKRLSDKQRFRLAEWLYEEEWRNS